VLTSRRGTTRLELIRAKVTGRRQNICKQEREANEKTRRKQRERANAVQDQKEMTESPKKITQCDAQLVLLNTIISAENRN
jgi:hypothetical protein